MKETPKIVVMVVLKEAKPPVVPRKVVPEPWLCPPTTSMGPEPILIIPNNARLPSQMTATPKPVGSHASCLRGSEACHPGVSGGEEMMTFVIVRPRRFFTVPP